MDDGSRFDESFPFVSILLLSSLLSVYNDHARPCLFCFLGSGAYFDDLMGEGVSGIAHGYDWGHKRDGVTNVYDQGLFLVLRTISPFPWAVLLLLYFRFCPFISCLDKQRLYVDLLGYWEEDGSGLCPV